MHSLLFILTCVCIIGLDISKIHCSSISSCPTYGCRPSGTFSVLLKLPSSEPKVIWNTTYGPIQPSCLGCVGNINNIVCPYQGLKLDGYVSIDSMTGKQVWYDGVLHNPSLPVMAIDGGIIGTDGHYLVKYEADGTQDKPSIPISPFLYPLYSIQLSENGFLFFASKTGIVFAYATDGIVLASIPLSGTVERANGTFLPITTPLVVGSRAYVLTEFKPDEDTPETRRPNILGMQRLYAIDIYARMVDRLHITWYYNFEREEGGRRKEAKPRKFEEGVFDFNTNTNQDVIHSQDNVLRFKPSPPTVDGEPLIMADVQREIVYVILPAPEYNADMGRMFWAIKDGGGNSTMLYKRTISAARMAMYEVNGSFKKKTSKLEGENKIKSSILLEKITKQETVNEVSNIPVWLLAESRNLIYKIMPMDGSIASTFNLASMLGGQATVTSDIMVTRDSDNSMDSVIFGVTIMKPSSQNYVISMDAGGKINWMVPTPSNAAVIGQIAGIAAEGSNSDDMFVAFGQTTGSDLTSVVFGIQ